MVKVLLKIAVMCALMSLPNFLPKHQNKIKSVWVGFCIAEGAAGLCGRCAWMYSVVFGELFGFIMLSVTVAGSLGLFFLLSGERGSPLLTALYIFFSSAENEYAPLDEPIINTAAHGAVLGCAGMMGTDKKRTVLMLGCALAGQLMGLAGTQIPASFAAISCCALLCNGIKNIEPDISKAPCCVGAVIACLFAYM